MEEAQEFFISVYCKSPPAHKILSDSASGFAAYFYKEVASIYWSKLSIHIDILKSNHSTDAATIAGSCAHCGYARASRSSA